MSRILIETILQKAGHKNIAKLIPKTIIDKRGRRMKVWVKSELQKNSISEALATFLPNVVLALKHDLKYPRSVLSFSVSWDNRNFSYAYDRSGEVTPQFFGERDVKLYQALSNPRFKSVDIYLIDTNRKKPYLFGNKEYIRVSGNDPVEVMNKFARRLGRYMSVKNN